MKIIGSTEDTSLLLAFMLHTALAQGERLR
jgi:hypothetical protein